MSETGGIPDHELRIEAIGHSRNPGGQHVGTGSPGVRVPHIPSNTRAEYDGGRSQHINKMIALDMILAALTHPKHRP